MLPIVNDSVEGEKVSIYNAGVHAKHPLNGLKLKNTTELHLMQGPITVFDGGAYAGDAQIEDLAAGHRAADQLRAGPRHRSRAGEPRASRSSCVSVKIVKGTLHATRKHTREKKYTVKNSGDKAKNVLVEYARWTPTGS